MTSAGIGGFPQPSSPEPAGTTWYYPYTARSGCRSNRWSTTMLHRDVNGTPAEQSRELLESLTAEERREVLAQYLAAAGGYEQHSRLSYAQRRIWFLEQLEPGTPVHHLSSGLRLSGSLQIPRLERALARVLERQSVLRSVFVTGADGEPQQRVLPPSEQVIPVSDLTRLPDQSLDPEAY